MNLAAVILDLDGTILDTESIDRRVWPAAAADCGYTLSDELFLALVGRSSRDSETALLRQFGESFPLRIFRERCYALWQAEVGAGGVPAKPGLAELLSFLDRHKLLVAIATSSRAENVLAKLRCAGLDGRFRHMVTGDQIVHGKPQPDIYLEAARRLGVEPAHCLAVEDSDPGVFAARAAGMRVLLIPDLKAPSSEARDAAFQILESLHQVPDVIFSLMTAPAEPSKP